MIFVSIVQRKTCKKFRIFFAQYEKYGISINASKSQFIVPFGRLVEHIISSQGIAIDFDNIITILQLSQPNTITEVRAFLDHVGYYR